MRRPIVGMLVLIVGVIDVALSAVLFVDQLTAIAKAGFVGAVMFGERAGPEAAALWFAVKGVLLVIVGVLARGYERLGRSLPRGPGWLRAGLGLIGGLVARQCRGSGCTSCSACSGSSSLALSTPAERCNAARAICD